MADVYLAQDESLHRRVAIKILADRYTRDPGFGIARATNEVEMTEVGSIVGTAQYLSPEQARGHSVGPQSDIYSMGVVLYEMLTGEVPFTGSSAVEIAMKQVNEAPQPPSTK